MKRALPILVVLSFTSCATITQTRKSSNNLDFDSFASMAESHAENYQAAVSSDEKFPMAGKDFVLIARKSQGRIFAKYSFASDPCIPRDVVDVKLRELNYIKLPMGLPTSHAIIEARDTYRLGSMSGTRSVNVEFWLTSNYGCLQHMFIDYPE